MGHWVAHELLLLLGLDAQLRVVSVVLLLLGQGIKTHKCLLLKFSNIYMRFFVGDS